MTIQQLQAMFNERYGRRNQLCFFHGFHDLWQLLNLSRAKLAKSIRKNEKKEIIAIRLADSVAWLFAVVNSFEDLPLSNAFIHKYGGIDCLYCGHRPCCCDPETRPEPNQRATGPVPANNYTVNTIVGWCLALDILYGKVNRERGVDRLISRCAEELDEVLQLTGLVVIEPNDLDALEWEFALELSDVLAHLIAIANFFKINLGGAIKDEYGEGCPACKMASCKCPRLTYSREGQVQRICTEITAVKT